MDCLYFAQEKMKFVGMVHPRKDYPDYSLKEKDER